jgi:hypothetical protein
MRIDAKRLIGRGQRLGIQRRATQSLGRGKARRGEIVGDAGIAWCPLTGNA